MGDFTLDDRARRSVIHLLAGDRAERYQSEVLIPSLARVLGSSERTKTAILDGLEQADNVMRVVLGHYAFSRRGGVGDDHAEMALSALKRAASNERAFLRLMDADEPPSLWDEMIAEATARKRKPNEPLGRWLVDGFLALAHELYQEEEQANIFHWIRDGVIRSGHIQPQFDALVGVRGVGPKVASHILRDVSWLYNVEDHIDAADRLLLQPIDAWARRLADVLTAEEFAGSAPDWIIAGKLSKACRRAGVSGVGLSMGMQYFEFVEARFANELPRSLAALANEATRVPYRRASGL